jgi:hypothetical protein
VNISSSVSGIPVGIYLRLTFCSVDSIMYRRYSLNTFSMNTSVSLACLDIVAAFGSGSGTQLNPFLTNRLNASLTVRGNVARPTHHHVARNFVFDHRVKVEGSRGGEVEKTRAMSFAWEEELSVIVVLMKPGPDREGEKGSWVERE